MWVRGFYMPRFDRLKLSRVFTPLLVQHNQHRHRLHIKMPINIFTITSTHTIEGTSYFSSSRRKKKYAKEKFFTSSIELVWVSWREKFANTFDRWRFDCVHEDVRWCGSWKNFYFLLSAHSLYKNVSLHGNLHHIIAVWAGGVRCFWKLKLFYAFWKLKFFLGWMFINLQFLIVKFSIYFPFLTFQH